MRIVGFCADSATEVAQIAIMTMAFIRMQRMMIPGLDLTLKHTVDPHGAVIKESGISDAHPSAAPSEGVRMMLNSSPRRYGRISTAVPRATAVPSSNTAAIALSPQRRRSHTAGPAATNAAP